jgi:cytidyltransferase-like protein
MSNWEKKYHIASSMPNDPKGFHAFLGRWQPLHEGHKQLFQQVLYNGDNVLILIRDIEPNEKNPFTAQGVMENICKEYQEEIESGRVKVQIVPNIVSINFGRGVGYDIVEFVPPSEVADISATKIREKMRENGEL